MSSNREKLLAWRQSDVINDDDINVLIETAQARPSVQQWQTFAKQSLLWLAIICLSVSIIFFFAYNWHILTRLQRFALVECAILVLGMTYVRFSTHAQVSKTVLMGMVLLTGSLLALVGQTYQTGADPWQLFAIWAVFIIPWAFIGHSSVMWIFWACLVNIALALYIDLTRQFLWFYAQNKLSFLWVLCIANTLLLVMFEWHGYFFRSAKRALTSNRYTQQILAFAAGCSMSIWFISHMFYQYHGSMEQASGSYAVWLLFTVFVYRFVIRDLLIIALCCLSLLIVSSFYFIDTLDINSFEELILFSSLFILAASVAIGCYIKKLSLLFNEQPASHTPDSFNRKAEDQEHNNG